MGTHFLGQVLWPFGRSGQPRQHRGVSRPYRARFVTAVAAMAGFSLGSGWLGFVGQACAEEDADVRPCPPPAPANVRPDDTLPATDAASGGDAARRVPDKHSLSIGMLVAPMGLPKVAYGMNLCMELGQWLPNGYVAGACAGMVGSTFEAKYGGRTYEMADVQLGYGNLYVGWQWRWVVVAASGWIGSRQVATGDSFDASGLVQPHTQSVPFTGLGVVAGLRVPLFSHIPRPDEPWLMGTGGQLGLKLGVTVTATLPVHYGVRMNNVQAWGMDGFETTLTPLAEVGLYYIIGNPLSR